MELKKKSRLFLVFEGIDGSGKDTQMKKLENFFKDEGLEFQLTSEPTDSTEEGRKLRELLSSYEVDIKILDKQHLLQLYIEDRKYHSFEIRRMLAQGITVISSRYDLSSYAYQVDSNKKMGFDEIYQQHNYDDISAGSLVPDLTFYFDLESEVAIDRITQRAKTSNTRVEGFEDLNFLTKTRNNYLDAIDFLRSRDNRSIITLSANQDSDSIHQQILGHINQLIHITKPV